MWDNPVIENWSYTEYGMGTYVDIKEKDNILGLRVQGYVYNSDWYEDGEFIVTLPIINSTLMPKLCSNTILTGTRYNDKYAIPYSLGKVDPEYAKTQQ